MGMIENSGIMDIEVKRLIEELKNLDPTSDDYGTVIERLNRLYALRNNQYKVEQDNLTADEKSQREIGMKESELEERKNEREQNAEQHEAELELKEKELAEKKAESERTDRHRKAELELKEKELAEKKAESERTDEHCKAELELKEKELAEKKAESERTAEQHEAELELKEKELAEKKAESERTAEQHEAELKFKRDELEVRKAEIALSDKRREDDKKAAEEQRRHEKLMKGIDIGWQVLKTAAMIGFGIVTSGMGYKFEETGSLTSTTFREIRKSINELIKK